MPYVAKCNFDAGSLRLGVKGQVYSGDGVEELLALGLLEVSGEEVKVELPSEASVQMVESQADDSQMIEKAKPKFQQKKKGK